MQTEVHVEGGRDPCSHNHSQFKKLNEFCSHDWCLLKCWVAVWHIVGDTGPGPNSAKGTELPAPTSSETEGLKWGVSLVIWKNSTKFSKHRSPYVTIMANSDHLLGISSWNFFQCQYGFQTLQHRAKKKQQVFSMFLLDFAACMEISWEQNSYCLSSMHQSFFARTSYSC